MGNEFGEILRALRKQHDYKQVEVTELMEKQGYPVAIQAISRWEMGTNTPNAKQFLALCSVYHVRDVLAVFNEKRLPAIDDTLNKEGREKVEAYRRDLIASGLYAISDSGNVIQFPKRSLALYDLPASAGTGQFLDSSRYEMIEVNDTVPVNANFGVRISGDSMEPEYHDGGIAWVQQQPELEDGEIGIFLLNGDAYLKLLNRNEEKMQLISLNSAYKPIDIKPHDDFRVFGKVVATS